MEIADKDFYKPIGKPDYIDATAEPATKEEKAELPKRASEKKSSDTFIVEKVTTTEKDGETVYCVYIDGVRYETLDKAQNAAESHNRGVWPMYDQAEVGA